MNTMKRKLKNTLIGYFVLMMCLFVMSQVYLYQVFMDKLMTHEVKSATNDITYYLNLLDLLEYQAYDDIGTTIDQYLRSAGFNTGALNMTLRGQHQLENYYVFDLGQTLSMSYTNIPLTPDMTQTLVDIVATRWDDQMISETRYNLGMCLDEAEGKILMNVLLIHPEVGHAYLYQFNFTNKILTEIPSSLYQNLYITLFNKRVAMDDILILRKKQFVTLPLSTMIPTLSASDLERLENGDYCVVKSADTQIVYKVITVDRDMWMTKPQILISNMYRSNEIYSKFMAFVVLVSAGLILLFALFALLLYRAIYIYAVKRCYELDDKITQSIQHHYQLPIQMVSDDVVASIGEKFERIRQEMLERMKFIDEMSYYDTVTGVGNIYLLEEKLKEAYSHLDLDKDHYLIVFEIQNIKAQFEVYGAGKMNLVYANIIAVLQSVFTHEAVFRKSDYSFAALFDKEASYSILQKVDEVKTQLKALKLELPIIPRFIIAAYPEHGESPKILIQNVDLAQQMFQDREIVFYSQVIKDEYLDRVALENDLRQAISNNEIRVVFQPVVCPNTNVIKGVETLIRWFPQNGRRISPDVFIPVAEQLGMIHELDQFVFEKALSMLALWCDIYPYDFFVSINSSPKWFTDPKFLPFIEEMLKRYPVDPSKVCIEIIETCLIEDVESAQDILNQLKERGLKVALDDFGKGYSSLNYLRKLNIDKLKIDKDFLSEMVFEVGKYSLVESIISMAHQMNLEVVVEGVETLDQVTYLKALDAELIQGYYYSKPVDKQVISDILLNSGVMRNNDL